MCYVWYLLIPTKRALLSLASPIHMQQLQTAGQCNAYNIATHLHVKHFYACFSLFASPFAASSRRYMRSYVSFMNNTLTQRLCLTWFVNNKRGKKKQQQQQAVGSAIVWNCVVLSFSLHFCQLSSFDIYRSTSTNRSNHYIHFGSTTVRSGFYVFGLAVQLLYVCVGHPV